MLDASQRIVVTGIGLTAPNGNTLEEYRQALLEGRSGVTDYEIRYVGKTFAGVCDYDETKHQKKKARRVGTRAGSIAVYSSAEAIAHAGLDLDSVDRSRVGVFLGITEHGNVETEHEVYGISQRDYDVKFWSHHHNPRTVANNPAGEVTINLQIPGPHYTLGAACAAGNAGLIQGAQMLMLGEVDVALAGGISEAIQTFGIFASFKAQGALGEHEDATKVSRPFDTGRNGIVVAEGGAVYVMETLEHAKARGANIVCELVGSTPPPPRWATSRRPAGFGSWSGTTPTSTSTTPRVTSATPWARPAPWSWRGTCLASRTRSSTRRSTSMTSTPSAPCLGS
jgi:3-oxoacyl-[acyl-carrier-protein] synthase II